MKHVADREGEGQKVEEEWMCAEKSESVKYSSVCNEVNNYKE